MATIDAAKLLQRLSCCKFCGGQPAIALRRGLRVYCPDCGRHKREIYYTIDEAVDAWNDDAGDDIPFYGDMEVGEEDDADKFIASVGGMTSGEWLPTRQVSGLALIDEDECHE